MTWKTIAALVVGIHILQWWEIDIYSLDLAASDAETQFKIMM